MSTVINDIKMNGAWYETGNRRRSDGKTFGIYTLCDDYNIRWLTHNLSKEVRRLKLSPKILFYLMHYEIVPPSLENVNSGFNKRLDDFSFGKMERFMRRRDRKMVWVTIPPCSLFKTHQRIEQEAVAYIHEHYPWELRNCLPDRFKEFKAISEEIIRNTDPKEARSADLSEGQKVWFWHMGEIPPNPIEYTGGGGASTPPIKEVFENMQGAYNGMVGRLSKYRVMNQWLEENHPGLHEFYLHGKGRIGAKDKLASSMRERLEGLDKLVNSKYANLEMIQTAFSQLKRLIEDDLLFTCVFYSYFYKSERGRPPQLKRMALNRVKPYVYYLKFFHIKPILWNGIKTEKGIEIKSIYDLGVLLLNALAGEKIYSTDKNDPLGDGEGGVDGRYYKFKGARQLQKELESFREDWRKLS